MSSSRWAGDDAQVVAWTKPTGGHVEGALWGMLAHRAWLGLWCVRDRAGASPPASGRGGEGAGVCARYRQGLWMRRAAGAHTRICVP